MKVHLLSKNDVNLHKLALIARLSRGIDPIATPDRVDAVADFKTVSNCFSRRHLSVFEFVRFTFQISAPVYVLRQLMRYRCGSYLERSLRYCDPPERLDDVDARFAMEYQTALDNYKQLVKQGVKKETARKVLPVCTPSTLIVQYSARELFHIFDERLKPEAQSETRELVKMIFNAVENAAPWIASIYTAASADLKRD